MNLCVIYKWILLFILVRCVRSADEQSKKNVGLVSYSDTESDSDGEDNFEVTETSEPSKSSSPKGSENVEPVKSFNKISFMKKSENGSIVQMNEGDYKQIFEDPYKKVYIFQKNLEMILFDSEVIFKHVSRIPYASSLTYYRINNVFIIQHENGFMFIRYERGKWRVNSRNRSGYLILYTKDPDGRYVRLGENDYYVTFGPKGLLRYEFKSDVNCSKVKFKKRIIWERKSNEPYPTKVSIDIKKDIILYFHDYFMIFLRKRGYKLLYKESRKK